MAERLKECQYLHKKGYTNKEIAEKLGVSLRSVQRYIKDLGVKPNLANTYRVRELESQLTGKKEDWIYKITHKKTGEVRYYNYIGDFLYKNRELVTSEASDIEYRRRLGFENYEMTNFFIEYSYSYEDLLEIKRILHNILEKNFVRL